MTLKIALTGGIGSGKSTVANYFKKIKVPVIDADKIVHTLLRPGTLIHKKTVSHFGKSILKQKKHINRKKLREIIFSDNKERLWLEKLLHPATVKIIRQQIKKVKNHYCIMVIPLLFETKLKIEADRILLVDCTKKNQIVRAKIRDKNSTKQIESIIKTQASRALRRQKSDDIINNNGSLKNLEHQVKKLHDYYSN